MLTAIVLTFNSESSLADVVDSVKGLADRVLVVDSFSTDGTEAIARELGCEWVQHPFDNYSAQRNWAQDYASLAPDDWVLHLDSDEILSPELQASIRCAIGDESPAPAPGQEGGACRESPVDGVGGRAQVPSRDGTVSVSELGVGQHAATEANNPPPVPPSSSQAPPERGDGGQHPTSGPAPTPYPLPPTPSGYLVRRLTHFWGRPIRHGHMNPSWHLRLFRAGAGRCEDRLYDQHFVCDGPTRKLKGLLLDMQAVDLERWTATHNRWSTAEAQEILRSSRLPSPEGPASKGTAKLPSREGPVGEANRGCVPETKHPAPHTLPGRLTGDTRERKRWIKNRLWYRLPLFLRAYAFFFYSYVLKLGFLDGGVGFVYHTLHAFWFRFLIDAKVLEARRARRG